ncbi:MAG: GTP-binding protein [Tepidisphaeraceae bacterium]|jgi:hydrogenase nickel incorporation protein HypB
MKTTGPEKEFVVNDQIVGSTRAMLRRRGIKTISLVGPPRSGKTALLERTGSRLASHAHVGVLVGSPAAGQKSTRLGRHGICALPLPGGELDAPGVHKAISMLNLDQIELLLIEGSGDMQTPSQRNHGQDLCVSVFSVADGPDQPNSFPHLIAAADLVLLTMVDLLPTTAFDLRAFLDNVNKLRADLPVIQASVLQRGGIDLWLRWLETNWLGSRWTDATAEPRVPPFADLSL